MMGYGLITLLLMIFFIKEKNIQNEDLILVADPKTNILKLKHYLAVVRNMEFMGYVFVICAGFCVFRIYTAESSFLFDDLGFTASGMGHFYFPLAIAYILGNLAAKRLVNTFSVEKVLRVGLFFFVTGGILIILSALFFSKNPYALIIPMSIVTLGNGLLFPVASAGAMTAIDNHSAGLASGLMGSIQFLFAACAIYCVGTLCAGDALSIALFLGGITMLGLLSYFVIVIYRSRELVSEA